MDVSKSIVDTNSENFKKSEKEKDKHIRVLDGLVSSIRNNADAFIENIRIEAEKSWFRIYVVFMFILSIVSTTMSIIFAIALAIGYMVFNSITGVFNFIVNFWS